MLLATLANVSKSFGTHDILKGVTWQISDGLKAGLVGENGAGKTTLFRLLTGEYAPDRGEVQFRKGVEFGYIEQEVGANPDATLRQEAMRALAHIEENERELERLSHELARTDHETDADALSDLLERYAHLHEKHEREGGYDLEYRLRQVLDGLSFRAEDIDRPLKTFSGGQKTRASLARVILRAPDLLLLDEPTNHLDIHAIEWLEEFLGDYAGAYIVISHDRYFLDRLCTEIVEMHDGALRFYQGNYSAFLEEREARLELAWKAYEQQQDEVQRMEDFVRKNIAGQKTKQAQSRRKMLEKVDRLPRPAGRARVMNLHLPEPERSGRLVLEMKNVSKSYGDTPILNHVSLALQRGDKMGVIGPNGAGKTTLLKLVLGREGYDSGFIRLGAGVQIGYFEQEQETLRGHHSVLEEIWKVTPLVPESEVRSFLGSFLFTGDEVLKPLNALSGGERGRLALARIVRSRANFLVLDEPTNHLDIPSRGVFEQALADFEGTVLTVSHDRYFLDRVVNQILDVQGGNAELSLGNYSDWKRRAAPRPVAPAPTPARTEPAKPVAPKAAPAAATAAAAKPAPARGTPSRSAAPGVVDPRATAKADAKTVKRQRDRIRRELDSLEAEIAACEARRAELSRQIEDPGTARDHQRLAELGREFQGIERELAALIRRWEESQANELDPTTGA